MVFVKIATNDRSALSSFRNEFFIPFRNASKETVGRTSCESNDGFPAVSEAERSLGKIVPKGYFPNVLEFRAVCDLLRRVFSAKRKYDKIR